MTISKLIFISAFLLSISPVFSQNTTQEEVSTLSIGEKIEFLSEIMGEKRVLNIYLPHGYNDDSLKKYPVIYLLDGSMDEDFVHISGLVQFASFPWINMLPESIVVGISNVDRKRDFTFPTRNKKDKKDFPTTGQSEKFIRFIGEELQPLIENRYRTDSVKTLIGQSLGGLLATEILFKNAELFSNYIIVSPSLWWDNKSLLEYTYLPDSTKKSIYIAVGKEGKVMEQTAKALYDKLNEQKGENGELYFHFFEKQNHANILHLAVYDAFEKMSKIKEE